MEDNIKTELESATFRHLLRHLDENKDVQNIDLMNLAGFCRNCLSKWYVASARDRGIDVDYEEARNMVYGMSYEEWKEKYQT
ncbi:MAG: DUF1244 domain-containing protein [Candidatus Azotimanducaceae bacterium]|uniref:DUF1244 domain-containing protein n=1 Tax=OM182 bacterium TaxID=2510334 RepID=A0A520RYK8_9GAMM|nr:deoxycytidine triphosphate deaminase [Gammaproteobacteria bacterium]RZO75288.1 MAG: DUF1244 domain-containing protein [OM182 bacterium]